jgi:hypothetical protein
MQFTFVPANSNTGASTLAIGALGAKSIIAANTTGSALVADDLLAAGVYTLEYDGTNFRKINGPDGAWTGLPYAANTLTDFSGLGAGRYRKLRNGNVEVMGVTTCNGNRTVTSGTTVWTLPAGYRVTGFQVIVMDNNDLFGDISVDINGDTKIRFNFPCTQNTQFLAFNYSLSIY